jgi:acyl-CoA reductase-like NAD-dependent aldehyde dehydrogenase
MTGQEQGTNWAERAGRVAFERRPFISDGFRVPRSRRSFRTENPATERPLASIADCNGDDVDEAVAAARRAFAGGWRTMAPERRQRHLLALADAVSLDRDTLALLDCLEMGMPITEALAAVDETAQFLRFYAACIDQPRGAVLTADERHVLAMNWHEPRGVIGIIAPWNYPLLVAASAIAPALAAGNTVVVKPSEVTPSSVLRLAAIAVSRGMPPGVINVVPGRGGTGAALARHGDVDQIQFTGSSATARRIMVQAGQSNGKPVLLEGGGKSPQIIFADALGLDGLGASIVASAFANSGQICVARTRLLVERGIVEDVVRLVAAYTERLFTMGSPLDEAVNFGPLASRAQRSRVQAFLDAGALEQAGFMPLRTGGTQPETGYFMQPGLFGHASAEMRVAREEIFGPLLALIPFDTEEEALRLANDGAYGLAATAWTSDLGRARRLMRDLDAGRVEIRSGNAPGAPLTHLAAEPFRGSGHGVLGGIEGMRAYQRLKAAQIITG